MGSVTSEGIVEGPARVDAVAEETLLGRRPRQAKARAVASRQLKGTTRLETYFLILEQCCGRHYKQGQQRSLQTEESTLALSLKAL